MNTKIYFNNKFILFEDAQTQAPSNQHLKTFQKPDDKELKKVFFDFIESADKDHLKIVTENFTETFKYLKTLFYYIEAAGGCIEKEKKYLFIHRFGKWDLPKGKLEKNETIEVAAVRECEEECAVKDLKIIRSLPSTYHIYAYKDGYALKQTHWFLMQTDYTGKLNPQLEESIDEVKWFTKEEIQNTVFTNTYLTIKDVITEVVEF